MKIVIDRKSKNSVFHQLTDALTREIYSGSLTAGARLPSVRDLAEQVGVAPMTISKAYAELKADGLIRALGGSGTFVTDLASRRDLDDSAFEHIGQEMDAVIDQALKAGIPATDLRKLVNERMSLRLGTPSLRNVMMVGLFADATESYAQNLTGQIGHLAVVEAATWSAIRSDNALREKVAAADLVLTFFSLRDDIERLIEGVEVVPLRFIPSEATRRALASLDPMANVVLVSVFRDFLPILSLGMHRFASHVLNVSAFNVGDPELPAALADCDVLVLATGADDAVRHAKSDALKIEYRHIPDPGDVTRLVIPLISDAKLPGTSTEPGTNNRKEAS